jgi:gliding motility-associated-like protein
MGKQTLTRSFSVFRKCLSGSEGRFVLVCLLFFYVRPASAQLILNPAATPLQLAQTIMSAGCSISNARVNASPGSMGQFTNAGSNIGIANGILLTTGQISIANGPNSSPSAGVNNGFPGDFSLDSLSGATTFDGASLEFDLIPTCDTLKINYVFGSEEYPEYVNRQFNDVFAFFISGPGFIGRQNMALVPGTTLPVSINSINANTNSQYYVDNTNGATIQYDAFTVPLTAKVRVTPCMKYHLKLVIADVLDGIFDSGVFIQGNSTECAPVTYNDIASNTNAIRSCADGSFSFCRIGDTTQPFTVNYTVAGTAISGVDFVALPGTITIPANQRCIGTNVVTLPNPGSSGIKTVEIIYQYGFCPQWDTLTLTISPPPPFDAGPDVSVCSGDTIAIGNTPAANTTYSWLPLTGLSNPAISNPKVTLVNNGNAAMVIKYVLTASNPLLNACVLTDSLRVTVKPLPKSLFTVQPDHCVGTNVSFTDNSIAPASGSITGWNWNFGNSLFDNVQNPTIKYTTAGTFTVVLNVTDNKGCKDDTSFVLSVWPLPVPNFSVQSACQGDSVRFTNTSSIPGGGAILQSIWTFGDGSPLISGSSPVHLYPPAGTTYTVQLIVTSSKNCLSTSQEVININPRPVAAFNFSPLSVCVNEQVKFTNGSNGTINQWSFGDGTSSTIRNPFHAYSNPGSDQVKLIVSTNFGCSDTISKTIQVFGLPAIDFVVSDTAGCPSFCTQFKGLVLPGSDSIASWNWLYDNGDNGTGANVTYCYTRTGKYAPLLVGTSNHGCSDTISKPFFIHVYPVPKAGFSITPNQISMLDPLIQFTNRSSPDATAWWWNFGDTKTDTGAGPLGHVYEFSDNQYTIWLKVKNQYGCTDSIAMLIYVNPESSVYVANAFTPNGDGMNDQFRPYCTGIYQSANYEMSIYDRWGLLLLRTTDLNKAWDGDFRGGACQQDVYVYDIYFTDKTDGSVLKKMRGTVTLLR